MYKTILLQQLEQSKKDCSRLLGKITPENAGFRLTEKTASVGFIYRHIGEALVLLAQSFGHKTNVPGTTMGKPDAGTEYDLNESKQILEEGYAALEKHVNQASEKEWLEEIDNAWFGRISRIKLYSITVFHNSYHCGQIASALVKGKRF
jgi:hypothetical protein